MASSDNPFSLLAHVPQQRESKTSQQTHESAVLESVFRFTLNSNYDNANEPVIYLKDVSASLSQTYLDIANLPTALFEFLMLSQSEMNELECLPKNARRDTNDFRIINYLYECYLRLNYVKSSRVTDEKFYESVETVIYLNTFSSLHVPDMYGGGQNVHEQLLEVIETLDCAQFFARFGTYLKNNADYTPGLQLFGKLMEIVRKQLERATLTSVPKYISTFFDIFCTNEVYATELMNFTSLSHLTAYAGIAYQNTLIGALLNISVLPKTPTMKFLYFESIPDQVNTNYESIICSQLHEVHKLLHQAFDNLLRLCLSTRGKLLAWIADCLEKNENRGKIWQQQNPLANLSTVSDGFMINLSAVLLKLCIPFSKGNNATKILKVDPTYSAVPEDDRQGRCMIHLRTMSKQTCLLPIAETEDGSEQAPVQRPMAAHFNFITECFYLTHKCLNLGFRVANEKLLELNRQINRSRSMYSEIVAQSGGFGSNSSIIDQVKSRLEQELQGHFSYRCVMREVNYLDNLTNFISASSLWLCQVAAIETDETLKDTFAPLTCKPITLPLNNHPIMLSCVPELIVQNIIECLLYVKRFCRDKLQELTYDLLSPIFSMTIIFMGSKSHMYNPHLRAQLAECTESLLPRQQDDEDEAATNSLAQVNNEESYVRKRLFVEHAHKDHLVEALLRVFIEIEATGESVQFEQKFNYRRPMYVVMDYIWGMEEHRACFRNLATEALTHIEDVQPPVFLRFVNLLLNDAVFLLDESLSNIAKIKEMHMARDRGEWDQLSERERQVKIQEMNQLGMLAKFDNIVGRETTHIIHRLSTDPVTAQIFTHPVMVDRVAAMLNYFLFTLVGPESKKLKVENRKEYEFDPGKIVLVICKIYIELKDNELFCLAISQDGRSYKPELFTYTENVLIKIGHASMIPELNELAERVAKLGSSKQADDELLTEAPDEFLDPIMSTIMLDPVILPSSKQTIDRSTITRHFLSDQSDPFNRAPMTLDQLVPNVDLAVRIHAWIEEKRRVGKLSS